MFDYRYYRTIRTPVDWKTGGHNIGDKKRKNNPSMGTREAGTQLSLSLFFSFRLLQASHLPAAKASLAPLMCVPSPWGRWSYSSIILVIIVITSVSLS